MAGEHSSPDKKSMKFLLVLFLMSTLFDVLACEAPRTDQINLSLSLENNAAVAYKSDRVLSELPFVRAGNCGQTALEGGYLMVAFGQEVLEFEDSIKGINFNRSFGYKQCELRGTPYKGESSYQNRLANFKENWKFIDSCLDVEIEDQGKDPLEFPHVQPGCTVTRLNSQKATFNGGYCYFKPGLSSSYLIRLKVKDQCLKQENLQALKIRTNDMNGAINLYVAKEASGRNSALRTISNIGVRVSINPDKDLIPVSTDFGLLYPTWPENWPMPDVHLSKITLKYPGDGNVKIKTPFLVNNNCAYACKKDFCQSPCAYAQPIVGEFSLSEKKGDKKELLASWFNGGIAAPKFQGIINGLEYEVPGALIEQGKEYIIESHINEPQYEYERFKNRIRNRLQIVEENLRGISNSKIPEVQEIPVIDLGRELPEIAGIGTIIFNQNLNAVETSVEALRSYLNFKLWPPYYAKNCFESRCLPLGGSLVALKAHIRITEINPEKKEINYEVISVERNSTIAPSYIRNNFHETEIICNQR
jgi:hypothetical protein